MSDHVLDQLSAYLDDELVPLERATIDVHLASCPACARQLEELAAVDRAARTLPAEAPAGYFDDFASRVRARVQTKAVRRPWRLPVFTLAAAAGLALAVLTPMLLREKPSPGPAAAGPEPSRVADADEAAAPLQEQPAPAATLAPAAPRPREGRLQTKAEPRSPSAVDSLGYLDARGSGGAAGAPALRDEGERRKDKRDEPRQSEPEAAAKRALAPGFAAAPEQKEELAVSAATPAAPAAAAAAPPPMTQPALKARERDAEAGAAVGKLEVQRSAANAQPQVAESRFRGLLAKKAGSAAEARALREEWRAFSEKAMGAEADEARVRVIEAGVIAYGLGNDAQDLARLESDATAYLGRPDAAQAARVQALLRSVGAEAP